MVCIHNVDTNEKLKFSDSSKQAKLKALANQYGRIYSFSLPSGYSCSFARECLSKSDRSTGRVTDGKDTLYRCFSATTEAAFPSARNQRWHNFDLLRKYKSCADCMAQLILRSMPKVGKVSVIRIHIGGDFFNQFYFDAWLIVATNRPDVKFYAYTKSLPYLINRLDSIPNNLELNASRGGSRDNLIEEYNLKAAEVVFHPSEAEKLNLEIDHDERHAINPGPSFALLLHGTQPKDSKASSALKTLKNEDIKFSYSA